MEEKVLYKEPKSYFNAEMRKAEKAWEKEQAAKKKAEAKQAEKKTTKKKTK